MSACLEHAVNEMHMDRWQYRRELYVRVVYWVKQCRNVSWGDFFVVVRLCFAQFVSLAVDFDFALIKKTEFDYNAQIYTVNSVID